MKITNFISKKSVALDVHPSTKHEAIDMLIDLLMTAGAVKDKESVRRDVLAREVQGSTGLSDGLATPHAQNAAVKKTSISIITVPEGVNFDSIDDKTARLLVLFAAPLKASANEMTELGRFSVLLMDSDFKEKLIAAKSVDEVLKLIDEKEASRAKAEAPEITGDSKIIAVTACPTGISSSFMARESLKNCAAKRRGGRVPFFDGRRNSKRRCCNCCSKQESSNFPFRRQENDSNCSWYSYSQT